QNLISNAKAYINFNLGKINGFGLAGKIYCPIKLKESPYSKIIEKETIKWARDMRLISKKKASLKHFIEDKTYKLACYCYADTPYDALLTEAKMIAFMFNFDDAMDRKNTRIGINPIKMFKLIHKLIKIFCGDKNINPKNHLHRAILDITRDMDRTGKDKRPFINSFRRGFQAKVIEVKNRKKGKIYGLEAYKQLRDYGSGVEPTLEIEYLLNNINVTKKVRENIAFRAASLLANRIISYTNDVLSLGVEIKNNDFNNIVLVKMDQDKISLEEAFKWSLKHIEDNTRAFLAWLKEFPQKEPYPAIANALKYWIRGNLEWASQDSKRYRRF
ncbi:hypothetical protein ACFL2K_03745, partial [Candidatus Margulisiibacteriota bacterium]